MSDWQHFLAATKADTRRIHTGRNDSHGLAFHPKPGATIKENVADYVEMVAWNGVGARQVVAAIGQDERWVKRALNELVEDGELRVVESNTRGHRASKRKTYYGFNPVAPAVGSHNPEFEDAYPSDPEYGAGGGREVAVGLPDW